MGINRSISRPCLALNTGGICVFNFFFFRMRGAISASNFSSLRDEFFKLFDELIKKKTPQETPRNFKITGRFLRFFSGGWRIRTEGAEGGAGLGGGVGLRVRVGDSLSLRVSES